MPFRCISFSRGAGNLLWFYDAFKFFITKTVIQWFPAISEHTSSPEYW